MLLVAIGWQMYDLTGSAWDLGLVGLLPVRAGPAAGAGGRPCGRPAAPRPHRRRLLGGAGRGRRWCCCWPRRPGRHDCACAAAGACRWCWARARLPDAGAAGAHAAAGAAADAAARAWPSARPACRRAIIGGPALGGLLFAGRHRRGLRRCGVALVRGRRRAGRCGCATHAPPRARAGDAAPRVLAGVDFIWQRKAGARAPSRSTCSRCCWAAPPRCCRSSPRTSCTPAPGAWACCAARRPWARC